MLNLEIPISVQGCSLKATETQPEDSRERSPENAGQCFRVAWLLLKTGVYGHETHQPIFCTSLYPHFACTIPLLFPISVFFMLLKEDLVHYPLHVHARL